MPSTGRGHGSQAPPAPLPPRACLGEDIDGTCDEQLQNLRADVSRLSGLAACGSKRVGRYIVHRDPPAVGGRAHVLDPIESWFAAFERPYMIRPEDVLNTVDNCAGELEQMFDDACVRERTLAWRLGHVLGFPGRVRDAAGFQSRLGQGVEFASGVLVQLAVLIVGGLIVAFLVAPLGWA
jgi:hypothetical protein